MPCVPGPSFRCDECGEPFWDKNLFDAHTCDDQKWLEQQQAKQKAVLDQAAAELRNNDNVAATLERWAGNATAPPCPEEDAAHVSLPALREFAEWQREHEGG